MNILVVSLVGESLILAAKAKQEGHDLIYAILNPDCQDVGTGLVWKTDDPRGLAEQADLILFDDNAPEMSRLVDSFRAAGKAVWCGGSFAERLEHDRLYGMEVYQEAGIPVPDTFEVSSLADVRAVLETEFARTEKLVIKLDGEAAAGSSFSFVARNPEICEEQVTHWVEDGLLGGNWSGIIQRFVEGIEVSTEAWWDGEEWSTHTITLEEKKHLAGDLGQSVGCAYNTIVRISKDSRLFKQVLEPLGPLLKKNGYVGQIDTNSIVDRDGTPHALEFTPRLGYDATPTLAWGNNHGYFNKILYRLGIGGEFDGFGYKGRVWGGVRVTVPPYPVEVKNEEVSRKVYETARGVPILGHEAVEEDFWLYDAMRNGDGLMCAGTSAMIGCAFGAGDDPREAGQAAYRTAERLKVPNSQWRAIDGWRRGQAALEELLGLRLIKFHEAL